MTPEARVPARGVAVMLAGGISAVGIALCVAAASPGLPTEMVVFLRFALAWVVLIPLWWRWRARILGSAATGVHLVRGAAGCLAVGLYFFTLAELPVGVAMALQFCAPLFAPPLAALVLRESTGWLGYLAVALAVGGAVLSADPQASGSALPVALGLLSAVISAGLAVHAKALMIDGESLVTVAFWFTLVGAFASGLYAIASGGLAAPGSMDVVWLAIGGLMGTLAQIFVFGAYRDLSTALFAVLKLLPIPLGAVAGYLLFGEQPTTGQLAGILLIGCGVALSAGGKGALRGMRVAQKRLGNHFVRRLR